MSGELGSRTPNARARQNREKFHLIRQPLWWDRHSDELSNRFGGTNHLMTSGLGVGVEPRPTQDWISLSRVGGLS
jgi:hypothetical protein